LRGSFVTCRQLGQVHTDQSVLVRGFVAVMVLMRPPLDRGAAGSEAPHVVDGREAA
jgi:hypothetical protein